MELLLWAVVIVVGAVIYFLPAIVSSKRNHPHDGWIGLLTLFTAWTGFTWLALLIWAAAMPIARPEPESETRVCPDCAEAIKAAARKCRFCGYEFPGPRLRSVE